MILLGVLSVNRWGNVMIQLLCTGDDQMEECDDTACVN